MALLLSKCLAMSKILELTCAVSQHVSIVNIVLKLNKRLQYAIIIIFLLWHRDLPLRVL